MLNRSNDSETQIRKTLQRKRGPALDKEMARRIGATKIPESPNACHAAAMVLTRALLSLPEKHQDILDDLVLAIEDENDIWIYDCFMAIMQKSRGKPMRPRETESTQKEDNKIISLIPGEQELSKPERSGEELLASWKLAQA